jgi:hypothetical protein
LQSHFAPASGEQPKPQTHKHLNQIRGDSRIGGLPEGVTTAAPAAADRIHDLETMSSPWQARAA